MQLSRDQPMPLYYQLKTLLTEEILSGAYGTDGRLPTEHELCARFGMSRTPVTRALSELANEGMVLRRRRHGTFVNPHWLTRSAGSEEIRVLMPEGPRWAGHLRSSAPPGSRLSIAQVGLNDLHHSFLRAVAEGHAPDLAMLDSVWMAEFAAAGFLRPLEELDAAWVRDDYGRDFLQPFVDAHRFEGKTLAVQAEMDLAGLWYSHEALASAGVDCPHTWHQLREVGRRIMAAGARQHALVMPAGPAADEFTTYCLVTLLASNGVRVLDSGAVTLGTTGAVEAMRLLRSLADETILSPAAFGSDRDRTIHLLGTGAAALAFGGSYEAPRLAEIAGTSMDELTGRFGFAPMPAGPRGGRTVLVGGFAYCIPRQARQPARAMRLLEDAVTGVAMARIFARSGQLPPRRSAMAELSHASPFQAVTAGLLGGAATRPVVPAYALVSTQVRAMMEAVLSGRLSAQRAVGQAADLISAITGLPRRPAPERPGGVTALPPYALSR